MVILFPFIHQELLGIVMDRWFTLVDCGQSDSSLAFINLAWIAAYRRLAGCQKFHMYKTLVGNHEDEDKIIAQ